jgi:hypothetical protein
MGTKVEQATRNGVVTDVRGRMITVQWATGGQTVFVPAPGTLTVLGAADTRRRRTNVSTKASRNARGAIPAPPSTTTKRAARTAPVPKQQSKVSREEGRAQDASTQDNKEKCRGEGRTQTGPLIPPAPGKPIGP